MKKQGHQSDKYFGEKRNHQAWKQMFWTIYVFYERAGNSSTQRDTIQSWDFPTRQPHYLHYLLLGVLHSSQSPLDIFFSFVRKEKLHSAVSYTNTNPVLATETPALRTFTSHKPPRAPRLFDDAVPKTQPSVASA